MDVGVGFSMFLLAVIAVSLYDKFYSLIARVPRVYVDVKMKNYTIVLKCFAKYASIKRSIIPFDQ